MTRILTTDSGRHDLSQSLLEQVAAWMPRISVPLVVSDSLPPAGEMSPTSVTERAKTLRGAVGAMDGELRGVKEVLMSTMIKVEESKLSNCLSLAYRATNRQLRKPGTLEQCSYPQ